MKLPVYRPTRLLGFPLIWLPDQGRYFVRRPERSLCSCVSGRINSRFAPNKKGGKGTPALTTRTSHHTKSLAEQRCAVEAILWLAAKKRVHHVPMRQFIQIGLASFCAAIATAKNMTLIDIDARSQNCQML